MVHLQIVATLTVVDNINNSSNFTNVGFFTVNTTQTHTNSGLTNDGVIAYPQGNPIPNVTNNDVIALPRASLCATFKPALCWVAPIASRPPLFGTRMKP